MTSTFHRFPHTPHLVWLGEGAPRQDKILPPDGATALLAHELVVEEKIDGANLGFSTCEDGHLVVQNRGNWLRRDSAHPQFRALWSWLAPHTDALVDALRPDLVLYGEWCAAVHSVRYDALPDWFLGFDVLDRRSREFWSASRRNELLRQIDLSPVPEVGQGRFCLGDLTAMLTTSRVGSGPMEGIYVRRDAGGHLRARAKLVRAEFVQAIGTHWRNRPLERNQLAQTAWN